MTVTRKVLISGASAILLLAGGCKSLGSTCRKPQAHATAQDLPPLRMPAGLDGPDTRAALAIPALNEPEAPHDPKGPCMDEPPAITSPIPAVGSGPAAGSGVVAPAAETPAETAPDTTPQPVEQPRQRRSTRPR